MEYINKKGEHIEVTLSAHAFNRFRIRWNLLYPLKKLNSTEEILAQIETLFKTASRIETPSKHELKRQKKHGNDSLYFKCPGFTFVVQNKTIVTIEISAKGHRELNNKIIKKINSISKG